VDFKGIQLDDAIFVFQKDKKRFMPFYSLCKKSQSYSK
jgi:hypothetical protein